MHRMVQDLDAGHDGLLRCSLESTSMFDSAMDSSNTAPRHIIDLDHKGIQTLIAPGKSEPVRIPMPADDNEEVLSWPDVSLALDGMMQSVHLPSKRRVRAVLTALSVIPPTASGALENLSGGGWSPGLKPYAPRRDFSRRSSGVISAGMPGEELRSRGRKATMNVLVQTVVHRTATLRSFQEQPPTAEKMKEEELLGHLTLDMLSRAELLTLALAKAQNSVNALEWDLRKKDDKFRREFNLVRKWSHQLAEHQGNWVCDKCKSQERGATPPSEDPTQTCTFCNRTPVALNGDACISCRSSMGLCVKCVVTEPGEHAWVNIARFQVSLGGRTVQDCPLVVEDYGDFMDPDDYTVKLIKFNRDSFMDIFCFTRAVAHTLVNAWMVGLLLLKQQKDQGAEPAPLCFSIMQPDEAEMILTRASNKEAQQGRSSSGLCLLRFSMNIEGEFIVSAVGERTAQGKVECFHCPVQVEKDIDVLSRLNATVLEFSGTPLSSLVTRAGTASDTRFEQLPKLVREVLDAKLNTVNALEESANLSAAPLPAKAEAVTSAAAKAPPSS
mmetsp:Transcript_8804/g.20743  ORF Transcript_8804/g.20743 Transcript_8804/m.20743 type:complete len:555 (-) Transcript_8804:68-1732(-)